MSQPTEGETPETVDYSDIHNSKDKLLAELRMRDAEVRVLKAAQQPLREALEAQEECCRIASEDYDSPDWGDRFRASVERANNLREAALLGHPVSAESPELLEEIGIAVKAMYEHLDDAGKAVAREHLLPVARKVAGRPLPPPPGEEVGDG